MRKVLFPLVAVMFITLSSFTSCFSIGNAAFESAISHGVSENVAASIANAVIDACEANQK